MEFEVNDPEKRTGTINLLPEERILINKALISRLLKAASTGETIREEDTLHIISSLLLEHTHLNFLTISGVYPEFLNIIKDVVEADNEEPSYDQAATVGTFTAQLGAASRILSQGVITDEVVSEVVIDRIINEIEIPDTIEGID